MEKYKLLANTTAILRTQDGAHIPPDPSNADYQDYLRFLDGNTPEPADQIARETTLSPSQQIILADGLDVATVLINGTPLAEIQFSVNGVPQTINLDVNGNESIELTCATPNTTILVQVGTAKAVVYAVEVPS